MERLFDPTNPYLASWVWIRDADSRLVRQSIDALPEHPSQPGATALYYAVLCGLAGLADYLISTHAEDVNAKCGRRGTPLHAASYKGHLDAVRLLLDHGADVNTTNNRERTPLCEAYSGRHLEAMRLLVKHGANVDVRYSSGLILHDASARGQADVVDLLLRHKADVDARGSLNWTPLHWVSSRGNVKVAQLLLEHGADINALSTAHNMPLHLACDSGHPEMVRILLGHGADVHGQGGLIGPHYKSPPREDISKLHNCCWSTAQKRNRMAWRGEGYEMR
ncbi:ankyrin repeat-containing domain protein [Russula brevipes]|nr:ankyrin repeat-containing domain protein [Russula brevipes]